MVIRKKTTRKTLKKTTTKRAPAKKRTTTKKAAFGGYKVSFKGQTHSLEKIFGDKPIAPSMMTKKLWAYVKKHKLSNNS